MSKLRLVVLGMMGRSPFGGQTWLYLNWLRGLAASGHEIWYIEDENNFPYDPEQNSIVKDPAYAVRHIGSAMARIGMPDNWAYRLSHLDNLSYNRTSAQIDELIRSCDALLNVCGSTLFREIHMEARFRVHVETDPVTDELRMVCGDAETQKYFREHYATHHVVVTYGENYGAPDCGVPLPPNRLLKTRQPIDLDLWPMAFNPDARYFTTIGNYKQAGNDVVFNGQTYYWSKHHEWEKFIDLPRRTAQPFELAMNCFPDDQARLESFGWRIVPPLQMSLDIFGAYPQYFRDSRAQFTVAKDQNVRLRSGWFSERDVCYLASGKPVVTQDTGFSNILPTGEGLFGISTMEQALAAIERINSDYPRQCQMARQIAVEYFDAKKVAAKFLGDLGLD